MLPGRYWTAWELPGDATDFDKSIENIISSKSKQSLLEKTNLRSKGVICPFYSWRIAALTAFALASKSYEGLSGDSAQNLEDELAIWNSRIASSRALLGRELPIRNFIGTLDFKTADFDTDEAEFLISKRNSRISEIKESLNKDIEVASGLKKQIERISKLTEGKKGSNAPDIWRTTFFGYIANQWVYTTGLGVPADGVLLQNALQSATSVASGGRFAIEKWGQAKTLRAKFKDAPPGEGFAFGDSGFLDIENRHDVETRGPEIKRIIQMANPAKSGSASRLFEAALVMRDHSEGSLSIVMRFLVLTHMLSIEKYLTGRGMLQLGWLAPNANTIKSALDITIHEAKKGSPAACGVVEACHCFNASVRNYITRKGWDKPFDGLDRDKLEASFSEMESSAPTWPETNGDLRAFQAAMILLDAYKPQASVD